MLEAEGFDYECYIDIFDGGPTVTAATDQIRTCATPTGCATPAPTSERGGDDDAGERAARRFVACYGQVDARATAASY